MKGRALHASINQIAVGTLQEVDGLWSFQYDADWLGSHDGFSLSPHLPLTAEPLLDGASKRPVQWYFDNLLPEEGQRVLLAGLIGVRSQLFQLFCRLMAMSSSSKGVPRARVQFVVV